jgi:outer membrane protein TolC
MGTYDHKQVLQDYATGKITVEMAVGHVLQHIEKLYEARDTADTRHYNLQDRLTALEQALKPLQNKFHESQKK